MQPERPVALGGIRDRTAHIGSHCPVAGRFDKINSSILSDMKTDAMYSLPEISDALKERVTFRIGMGQETVFMTTEYGDVAITDKCVMYPGNPYEFARRGRVLADYCDSIIEGVEKYSSPEMRIKKMLDEMSRHKYDISAIKVLWFESEHGRVLLDGGHVRYPGNPKCFSRDAMTLQEWCAFLLDGIEAPPATFAVFSDLLYFCFSFCLATI